MLWHVSALLEDRPGALAALATSCGNQNVNILGLEIFPASDGRVVDEVVVHTPGGWNAAAVTQLFELAGIVEPTVSSCSPHALQDQPVRWLRAAGAVANSPDHLERTLARLLDAQPLDGLPGDEELVLDDGPGPLVRLHRRIPFTDTEVARAAELRRVAARVPLPERLERDHAAVTPAGSVHGADSQMPLLRSGTLADVDALIALHGRSSLETLRRRYQTPVSSVSRELAQVLLEPMEGTSLVLAWGEQVVGHGVLAAGPDGLELGLLVEDGWQRQGHGSRLLHRLAIEAAERGAETVTCAVQPGNQAVPRTIHRSGLRARVSYADGLANYKILVSNLAGKHPPGRRPNRSAMGPVTTGLVALLHERGELREVYPPAAAIDQAVRGGA